MASSTDICNLALSHIRGGSINSMEDNTQQAKQCALFYDILLDQMLTDNPWPFAKSVKPLSLLDVDVFGYSQVYKYPSDCLYIEELLPEYLDVNNEVGVSQQVEMSAVQKFKVPYEIMSLNGVKVIVTNYSNLRIRYRNRVTDAGLLPVQFYTTFSYLLAANLAIPLIGMEKGRALRQDSFQLYETYLQNAVAASSNESYKLQPESDFITVRS